MNEIIKNIEEAQMKAEVPAFNVGDTVRVSAKIKEGNRERIQVFEGTVLKKQGTGVRSTFTVRKISNGVGVEKTWPLHSPIVEKVDVVRRKYDKKRANYYKANTERKWDNFRDYDLVLDSAKLGIDGCVDALYGLMTEK